MTNTKRTHQSGFSLVIAAVILMALGTVTAFMIRSESATSTQTFNKATYDSMEKLWGAIEEYAVAKGKFPCPASLTTPVGSDNYGKSIADCNTGSAPSGVDKLASGTVWRGMVPVKTLGVPIDWAIDKQGNRIVYVVSKDGYPGSYNVAVEEDGTTHNVDFILMNMGIDGMGAYSTEGSAVKSCIQTPVAGGGNHLIGGKNCSDDGNFVSRTIEASNTTEEANYYDDTVMYTDGTPLVVCSGATTLNWGACSATAGTNRISGNPAHWVGDATTPDYNTGGTAVQCTTDGAGNPLWVTSNSICTAHPASGCPSTQYPTFAKNVCSPNIGTVQTECNGYPNPTSFYKATGNSCGSGTDTEVEFHCCRPTCPSQTINWSPGASSCSQGSGGMGTYGDPAKTITDSTGPATGSVSIQCQSNGTWSQSSENCVTPCPANQTINWGSCTATSGASANYGDPGKVINDTASSHQGSVTITCNASGAWQQSSPSCAPITCPGSQTISWSDGANNCSASSGASGMYTDPGKTITDSTGGETGSATITCNASGSWVTSGTSCNAAPPPPSASGALHDWGLDNHGRLGNGGGHNETGDPMNTAVTTLLTNQVIQVSASNIFACAVNSAGNGFCWGGNSSGRLGAGGGGDSGLPRALNTTKKFSMIAAGQDGSCALATDGTIWCWGENNHGDHGDGSGADKSSPTQTISGSNWKFVTQGLWGGCGIKTDDTLHCWGDNSQGQLGRGSAGGNRFTPGAVSGGGAWKYVSRGNLYACGIKSDDRGYCWGHGTYGKLGDGSTANNLTPVEISGGHRWKIIDTPTNSHMTCGITTGGEAYCWGRNQQGSLGNGLTSGDQATPQKVQGYHEWIDIAVGRDWGCAINAAYELWCWGNGEDKVRGQGTSEADSTVPVKVGPSSLRFFEVEAADKSTYALRYTGSVPTISCPSGQAISWTVGGKTCSATTPSGKNYGSAQYTISDSTGPDTGSAQVTCYSDGQAHISGATSCATTPTGCSTSTLSWGAGCSASFTGITNGSTSPSTTNTASGYTGSATATCTAGVWGTPSGTCSASSPPPGNCNPGDTSPGTTVACDSDDVQALANCKSSHGAASTDYVVSLGLPGGMCGGGDPLEDYKCCKTSGFGCTGGCNLPFIPGSYDAAPVPCCMSDGMTVQSTGAGCRKFRCDGGSGNLVDIGPGTLCKFTATICGGI